MLPLRRSPLPWAPHPPPPLQARSHTCPAAIPWQTWRECTSSTCQRSPRPAQTGNPYGGTLSIPYGESLVTCDYARILRVETSSRSFLLWGRLSVGENGRRNASGLYHILCYNFFEVKQYYDAWLAVHVRIPQITVLQTS